jgi:hypothetical protein
LGAAGATALTDAARSRLAAGEPVEALYLTDLVLAADPADAVARSLAADASRALLDGTGNFWERAWLTRSIDRLEES